MCSVNVRELHLPNKIYNNNNINNILNLSDLTPVTTTPMITSTESSSNVTEAPRVIISYAPATPSVRSKTMAATFSTLASVCIICCVVVMVLWARRYQRRQRKLKRMSAFVVLYFLPLNVWILMSWTKGLEMHVLFLVWYRCTYWAIEPAVSFDYLM